MEHKQQIDLSEYHERAYGNKALSDDALSKYAEKAIEHVSLDKRARNTRIKVIMLRVSGILIAAVLLLCIIWPDLARAFISVLGFQ